MSLLSRHTCGGRKREREMVSQRQRNARKRFKEANAHLFPEKPSNKDLSSSTNNRKHKKKSPDGISKKRRRTTTKVPLRKHPLRVPGMKPGDSCFICKDKDHIAKSCPKKFEWDRNKICLHCRERGHSLKNCPGKDENTVTKYCYNCGEGGHSLSNCRQPLQDGGTKFAKCFICNEPGHLSKTCPQNTHGVYPKGGSCKICGLVTHLAKDCPVKGRKGVPALRYENTSSKQVEKWQGKLTVFRSGDDLEDDFTAESERNIRKAKMPESPSNLGPMVAETDPAAHVKTKKLSGAKVINFTG